MNEGIFDKILGKRKENREFEILPKEHWIKLLERDRNTINLLANTPSVADAAGIINDIVKELEDIDNMAHRKLSQQIRVNTAILKGQKQGDKSQARKNLMDLVKKMRREAEYIRSVRQGRRIVKGVNDSLHRDLNKALGLSAPVDVTKSLVAFNHLGTI